MRWVPDRCVIVPGADRWVVVVVPVVVVPDPPACLVVSVVLVGAAGLTLGLMMRKPWMWSHCLSKSVGAVGVDGGCCCEVTSCGLSPSSSFWAWALTTGAAAGSAAGSGVHMVGPNGPPGAWLSATRNLEERCAFRVPVRLQHEGLQLRPPGAGVPVRNDDHCFHAFTEELVDGLG